MGLLNFGSSLDDPRTQGLLALGLGLMGGRGNFGQVLSQAGMQGLGAYQAGQDRVSAQKRSGLQQAMLEMQMAAAKRAAEQEERDRALLAEYSMPRFAPGASVMKPGSMAQGPLPLNPMEVLQKGGSMPLLQQLSSLQTMGLPKVARTVEVDDGKGGKATMQLDEFGRPVGQQLPGYVAPVQVNQGDKVTFARPQAGVSLPVGMSPSERDASARGWESNRLAKDRFAFDKEQANTGKWSFDPTRGVRVNAATGQFAPIAGPDGKPLEPKPSSANLSEGERKAGTLYLRLEGALKDINDVSGANPKAASPGVGSSVLSVLPLVGGPASNLTKGADRRKIEAAQLDALDAALTLGTGAAYTREQLEGYREAYFPTVYDTPAEVAMKRQRFERVVEAARLAAGRAADVASPPQNKPAAAPQMPEGLDILNQIEAELNRRGR